MKDRIKHMMKRMKDGILVEIWVGTKWIYQYARRYWKAILFYTLIGLLGTAVSLTASLISKKLVDIITMHQPGQLITTFALSVGFAIGNIVVAQVSNYVSSKISIQVDNDIKADVFNKILVTDWEAINSYHTGDLLTRWSSDASTISSGILNWIPNLIIFTIRFISSFAIVMYYNATFAIIALLGMPVGILMSGTLLHRMKDSNKQFAAINAKMSGFNQETFSNIQIIKAFHLIRSFSLRLIGIQNEYLDMKLRFQKLTMKTSFVMSFMGILVSNLCYGWGIYLVWKGSITYGTMTLFLSLSGSMSGNLNSLISLIPTAVSISTSAGRLKDILDMPREDDTQEPLTEEFYRNYMKEGITVRLTDLTYSYQTGTKVFEKISFEAHPHEIVALVGPTGEGKSTLLRILLALLHPQDGQYNLYGGKDHDDFIPISPASRRLFSYVPQGNTMFSGTIAENMRNAKSDASDNEIIDALRAACAWDFVNKLPDGIYSRIGERGAGLSEGQSQRLSIARALLRKSPILLMDEATSALDVATERKILKNIRLDEYPRTCIITTHRPTVLSICTKVYGIKDYSCHILSDTEISELINAF